MTRSRRCRDTSPRGPRSASAHALLLPLLAFAGTTVSACTGERPGGEAPSLESSAGGEAPRHGPVFVDQADESGLDFVHFNGMSGEYYFAEMTGSGAALFDYDGDGDLDAFLLQGHMLGGKAIEFSTFPPPPGFELGDRLYRNDLADEKTGRSRLRFTDVTISSELASTGYGMGAATGDYDNDGWIDLYVTNFGPNRLFRNRGDGTFEDRTGESGTDDPRWSVAAAFVDFDRDGWLDLYVGNYVSFSIRSHKLCRSLLGAPDYCGPLAYEPVSDRLFHNRGDGTFDDVTVRAGLAAERGAGLGMVPGDFDGDGWIDLYVANDGMRNHLWMNRRNGTFAERAVLAGCALNAMGQAQASMGVDAGDFDRDGDEDLFMTHLTRETNTLYANDGTASFAETTQPAGLGQPSWELTGFGSSFLDYDNDGWLDLLTANGAVKVLEEQASAGDPYPLRQPNQLFRNLGDGRFAEVSAAAGASFALAEVSRGAAFGDVDNDGDTDVLVNNNSGPARLLVNQVGQSSHWIGLRLATGSPPRDALGAWVRVVLPDGRAMGERALTAGSYASAGDPRVLLGLGALERVGHVEVWWPDGRRERFAALADRYTQLVESEGEEMPR